MTPTNDRGWRSRAALLCLAASLLSLAHCRRRIASAPSAAVPVESRTSPRRQPPGPWNHDEAEAEHRDPTRSLQIRINGTQSTNWTPQQLNSISPARVQTKKGEQREGWWLDEVAKRLVGDDAHVVALRSGEQTIPADGSKRLLLRVMRDGHYKVSDDSHATLLRDVEQLDVETGARHGFASHLSVMDVAGFQAINGLAGREQWVDRAVVIFVRAAPFALVGVIIILWFSVRRQPDRDRIQRQILATLIAVCVALLINQVIIHLWNRPRPFAAHPATLLMPPSTDPSFPSDHATFAFAVAVGLLFGRRSVGLVALMLAAILALSRVYIGEHYPSDVVAGATIGALTAWLLHWRLRLLEPIIGPLIRVARRLRMA